MKSDAQNNLPATGQPLKRLDGLQKVTGKAQYSADWVVPHVLHGVIIQSSIATGKIRSFDLTAAKKVPGVVEIITFQNAPKVKKPGMIAAAAMGESFIPLQDDKIFYNGQAIGVVLSESLEAAKQAAELVRVNYLPSDEAKLDFETERKKHPKEIKHDQMLRKLAAKIGDVEEGKKNSKAIVSGTYTMPIENHNPMEPSATLALWENGKLKVYDATQGVGRIGKTLAAAFKIKDDEIQIITKFVGGGFGCKGAVWSHVFISIMAAAKLNRPVKLSLTRPQMFTGVGHRSNTIQKVTLGANEEGLLQVIDHETINPTAINKDYTETTGALFKLLYSSKSLSTVQRVVKMNYPVPTFMRAPGESSGSFALESAIDELADALKMDPIEFRLKNSSTQDPVKNVPFSSKKLSECFEVGAKKFGWDRRKQKPKSIREGDEWVGYGVATCSYPVHFFPGKAKIELHADGTAQVVSATQDIGTGTYTVMAQLAADALQLKMDQVKFDLGDSHFPPGGLSGGSSTVSTVGWAIHDAAEKAFDALAELASHDKASSVHGLKRSEIEFSQGRIHPKNSAEKGENYFDVMKRNQKDTISVVGEMNGKQEKLNEKKYSMHSHGAQFVEVRVHALTGEVRLVKLTGAFACGKIVNPRTARSQFMGGMIFGVGMGLMEHTAIDPRNGRFVVKDLADYHVPVNLDIPEIDVIMVDEVDHIVNPAGTKGIGEIGTVGTAAAIANAVFNATGVRIRDLPITPEKLAIPLRELS